MTGIKKLKTGRYQARYFAGHDGNGKRNYPSKTFGHYGDAVKWRTARIREKDLGEQVESSRMTVSEYLNQWLESRLSELRTNTIKTYRDALKYIIPHLGDLPLQSLRPRHIDKWQQGLLKTISASTLIVQRTVFGTALKKAVRLRYIHSNPILATDPPHRIKSQAKSLTLEQAHNFIQACSGQRWGLSYKLALAVGLRPEETHGLKWSCVDLTGSQGRVSVKEVVVSLPGGGWQFEPPKSRTSFRSVMFGGDLVKDLRTHRAEQLQERMAMGRAWHDHDLVFCSAIGTPVNPADYRAQYRSILKLAGIEEKFRLYDLRHSFATLSLLAQIDFKTVSQELGHSSSAITLDTYAHVLREMEVRSATKRERLLRVRK